MKIRTVYLISSGLLGVAGVSIHAILSMQCNHLRSSACTMLIAVFPQSRESLAIDFINRARSTKKYDPSSASQDLNSALAIDPGQPQAHFYRGLLAYEQRKMSLAIEEFGAAIKSDPAYENAYNNRGTVFGVLGQYREAIADFSAAIKISPNQALAYANRGYAELLDGDKVSGQADLQAAKALGYKGTEHSLLAPIQIDDAR